MNETVSSVIKKQKVVSILRGITKETLEKSTQALYDGGIRCLEITLNTENALEMIQATRKKFGDAMLVGAGTVLDPSAALLAIQSGAQFVLAPTLDIETISLCHSYGCACIPGVFTATEALTATRAGADMVKLFPCSSVGPTYLKDIKAPLSQLQIMAVGGITAENTPDFLKAGACAVGVGSGIFSPELANQGEFQLLKQRAESFTTLV